MYYNKGRGVDQNYKEAVKWFRLAADQGNIIAQFNLGVLYDNGQGVDQDYAEAMKLYRLAADQGRPTAQSNLGVMYEKGNGVDQDYTEAAKWYRLAAEQGRPIAQNNLGVLYHYGKGVDQSYIEAEKWYHRAAAQGYENAQENLEILYIEYPIENVTSESNAARDQSTPLERFVNEYIVHNPTITYPIVINESSTLTSRDLIKKNGVLYVVDNLKLSVTKEKFVISIKEFKELVQSDVKGLYCSSAYVSETDYLFKGYSTVGIIQKTFDANGEFVAEIIIDRSSC